MAEISRERVSVNQFVKGLAAMPPAEFRPGQVLAYLVSHPVEPSSLHPYLLFSPASYTRNLIFKNELFELIAICWEIGQASRIHNHRDQQCWMAVPIGKLKNQNYLVVARNPEKKSCCLDPSRSFLITPDSPLQVDPHEPVHQVLNLAEFGERAVSLHVYSHPFSSCEVYSLDKGLYWDVDLYYDSEYGRRCTGGGEMGKSAKTS